MNYRFDHCLFQRGLTWTECCETWTHNRDEFLRAVLDARPLETTAWALEQCQWTKLAVVFTPRSIDALLSIPLLGKTFANQAGLQARYFDYSWFFPVFPPQIDRRSPRLLGLDRDGVVRSDWGPRPEKLTANMPPGILADSWLRNLDPGVYGNALDESVSQFLLGAETP